MEGEIALPLEHVQTHHMSWAQWFKDSYAPGVYRNKWFERCHMQHAIARLSPVKSEQLQTAWMNGSGMLIWENVFGLWLGWNENDKATYRAVKAIQIHFANIFSGEYWTPLSQESPVKGVFINLWEKDEIKLWTLINRNESVSDGILMKTELIRGIDYYDLVSGEKIVPRKKERSMIFSGTIAPRGIACFLSIPRNKTDSAFKNFIARQREQHLKKPGDTAIPVLNNRVTSKTAPAKHPSSPGGMVSIPAASLNMTMEYNFRECGAYGNIQDHLVLSAKHKLHSTCSFTKQVNVNEFLIDETPVTNAHYQEFIKSSGYKPEHPENFLKHWIDGKIPRGKEDHPVVYVGLADAKAYAGWAGKRLPSEEEWQIAAQGPDLLSYPWGNEMRDNMCNQNTNGVTTPVSSFPEGKSTFGCYDMCGNTWELTANEYSDGKTRFVMLKGGSCFKAEGSVWYMDGGPQKNSFFAKMLLMWPGLDRCSTVGFRCAADPGT
jgi:formylglycine-generating enzyme required for sulfatase activity